jgi:hypothetical protein
MPTTELIRPSRRRSDRVVDDSFEPSGRLEERSGLRPDAFSETNGTASLFAAVRPCDGVSASISRSSATAFDANASATTWILEAGLKGLDPSERKRIVDGWSIPRRNRWPSLITDESCDVRIGDTVVTGAVRVALLDWVSLSGNDLAVYETGIFREAPAKALALLVRPPTIWSIGEALIADLIFPRGPRFEPARFDALERHAFGYLRSGHLARLRRAAARVEMQLPVERFPVASSTVAAGCAVVARDDEWCAVIAARQLARYASSAVIGRGAGS